MTKTSLNIWVLNFEFRLLFVICILLFGISIIFHSFCFKPYPYPELGFMASHSGTLRSQWMAAARSPKMHKQHTTAP